MLDAVGHMIAACSWGSGCGGWCCVGANLPGTFHVATDHLPLVAGSARLLLAPLNVRFHAGEHVAQLEAIGTIAHWRTALQAVLIECPSSIHFSALYARTIEQHDRIKQKSAANLFTNAPAECSQLELLFSHRRVNTMQNVSLAPRHADAWNDQQIAQVVIASWARTPIGKFNGALAKLTAPQLGAAAIRVSSGDADAAETVLALKKQPSKLIFLVHVMQAGSGVVVATTGS